MKEVIYAALLALGLSATLGCGARFFSARSQATYEAYGAKLTYDSSKNQENFHARIELDTDGKVKTLDVKTTATTSEAAAAAAWMSMAAFADALTAAIKELAPLAKAAATSGS